MAEVFSQLVIISLLLLLLLLDVGFHSEYEDGVVTVEEEGRKLERAVCMELSCINTTCNADFDDDDDMMTFAKHIVFDA